MRRPARRATTPSATDLLARSRLVDGDASPSHRVALGEPDLRHHPAARRDHLAGHAAARRRRRRRHGRGASCASSRRSSAATTPRSYVTGRLWVEASDGVRDPGVGRRAPRRWSTSAPTATWLPGRPRRSCSTATAATRSRSTRRSPSLRLSLLDRGVIFAIAHVRGGGEMGRSWYEMGRLAQKPTTFSDFVAVARDLVAEGWTTPGPAGGARRLGRRAADGRRHEPGARAASLRGGRGALRRRAHDDARRQRCRSPSASGRSGATPTPAPARTGR